MGRESRSKAIQRQVRLVEKQIRLPLVDALVDVRADMLEVVVTAGMKVVEAMLEEARVRVCGPKHARVPGREVTRGGTVNGELILGGRRVSVRRPRARRVGGGEVRLPTYEALRREDPLVERAVEQMLVGVSTRKYARSLEPLPAAACPWHEPERGEPAVRGADARGAGGVGAAPARRAGPRRARDRRHRLRRAHARRRARHRREREEHALAIREGTTENASLCRSMLADLVARGVPADRAILVVIDGGTGLRSAVKQVFGEYAVVQRCQVHKKRNVLDHLPDHAKPHVRAAMNQAYALDDFDKAKGLLERLAKSLEEQHPSAASSLREGPEETLTVLKLGVGRTLRKSLSTTNPIESTFSTVRRVSRRVTRWPTGMMALRSRATRRCDCFSTRTL